MQIMTNPSNTNGPSSDVKSAIESSFGSVDELKTKFNAAAAARFGSGTETAESCQPCDTLYAPAKSCCNVLPLCALQAGLGWLSRMAS